MTSMVENLNLFHLVVKMRMIVNDCGDTSVLEEKASFKVLVLAFHSKLIWRSNAISISKEIGGLIRFKKFPVFTIYFHKSTMWPARNTIAISGLVPLIATWICLVSDTSGLLVLHLLFLVNSWLTVEI